MLLRSELQTHQRGFPADGLSAGGGGAGGKKETKERVWGRASRSVNFEERRSGAIRY